MAGPDPWAGAGSEVPEGYRTLRQSGGVAPVRRAEPRSLPGVRPEEGSTLAVPQRPLGFNCPSCGVVLVIREPDKYDGEAAPCPHCAVNILPPRIVYTATRYELPAGLSLGGLAGGRMPRALPRMDRRGRVSWRDTQGEVLPADR